MQEAPRTVGRYEVLRPIGRGGMGEVLAARLSGESGFERWVAIKRIRADLSGDERLTTMFFDEARTAACIHSPFAVPVLDVGRDEDGAPFMVMELVLGPSVRELLDHGPLPIEAVLAILLDACRGLEDAHTATDPYGTPLHLVHRDVSPHNVLVGVDGRARLTDFGVARAAHRRTVSGAGEIKGTFAYLAPEQAMGSADGQSDVFSLGVVAWEMLTHQRRISATDPAEVLTAVLSTPVPRVAEVAPHVPASLAGAVDRAVMHDRSRRFRRAADFARELAEAASAEGITVASRAEVASLAREAARETIASMRACREEATARPPGGGPTASSTVRGKRRLGTQPTAGDTLRNDLDALEGLTLDTLPDSPNESPTRPR